VRCCRDYVIMERHYYFLILTISQSKIFSGHDLQVSQK
jgi:hypothetical protein